MSLGTAQRIQLRKFKDCIERTKKKVTGLEKAEDLIYFMLDTSSIVEHNGNRSYQSTVSMIDLICKRLCPGQWCTRSHCKNYCSGSAYYCNKTRPAICTDYKKYIEKREQKKNTNN